MNSKITIQQENIRILIKNKIEILLQMDQTFKEAIIFINKTHYKIKGKKLINNRVSKKQMEAGKNNR